ncbi:MAG: serpin family protein [Firmicutes bacterium]|nr:serpin family protein [Bacillota bacterium]
MKKTVSILVALIILSSVALGGCASVNSPASSSGSGGLANSGKSLMEGIKVDIGMSESEARDALKGEGGIYVNKFALALMKEAMKHEDGNLLISPISVIYAMAMTANGADGMSECELVEVLSEGIFTGAERCGTSSTGEGDIWDEIRGELNSYLRAYLNSVAIEEAHDREYFPKMYEYEESVPEPSYLRIANSIWFKDNPSLKVNKDFLEINGQCYDAGAFAREFNEKTRKEINAWIEDKTEGTIKDMLNEMPDEAEMFLVNALAFQGEWDDPFNEYQISKGTFHGENDDTDGIDFMTGSNYYYIDDGNATGFIKHYKGYKYAFIGILPNEGMAVDEYIDTLEGVNLNGLILGASDEEVIYTMPKFKEESAVSLVDVFKGLGVENSFDPRTADFSQMATSELGNIFIGDILHNTYIDVNENGTTAGAATVVEMCEESAMEDPPEPKEVLLDRPFIYMLADVEEGVPLFIGIIRDL